MSDIMLFSENTTIKLEFHITRAAFWLDAEDIRKKIIDSAFFYMDPAGTDVSAQLMFCKVDEENNVLVTYMIYKDKPVSRENLKQWIKAQIVPGVLAAAVDFYEDFQKEGALDRKWLEEKTAPVDKILEEVPQVIYYPTAGATDLVRETMAGEWNPITAAPTKKSESLLDSLKALFAKAEKFALFFVVAMVLLVVISIVK